MIDDAVESILINDQTKRDYRQLADHVFRLYKAIMPDTTVDEFLRICTLINVIARKIKNLTEPADISGVMTQVEIPTRSVSCARTVCDCRRTGWIRLPTACRSEQD